MHTKKKQITVFEHQTIKVGQEFGDVTFDVSKLKAFASFYGTKGVPYFSLIHNGIKFNEYVGVIQVGDLVVEILPKADNVSLEANEKNRWRDVLIGMLHAVGVFDIHAPSSSNLKLKPNSILDLYFALFIKEVEYLLHNGLVKKYHKKEGNATALKGNLLFAKQIQQNITHQERFYVRYTTYDVEHQLHFILYKTLKLLKQINTNKDLQSRIGALLLNFPEMPDLKVNEKTFSKIVYDRKTQAYKKSIEIASLLLLQYHPDLNRGENNVLALMFDMNVLWEKFIYATLKNCNLENTTMTPQTTKYFWEPKDGYRSKMRPDIVIKNQSTCIVLDTKWKNLNGYNPSSEDLRQMYVYHEYYDARKVALVYPCPEVKSKITSGHFLDRDNASKIEKECSIILLSVASTIKDWQDNICLEFRDWFSR